MKALVWVALTGVIVAVAYFVARWRRQWAEREKAAEQRFASFIAQAKPAVPQAPPASVPVMPAPQ